MFFGALEKAFDAWFQTKYPWLTPDDPRYFSNYHEEVTKFAEYLVSDFVGAVEQEEFWANRENSD